MMGSRCKCLPQNTESQEILWNGNRALHYLNRVQFVIFSSSPHILHIVYIPIQLVSFCAGILLIYCVSISVTRMMSCFLASGNAWLVILFEQLVRNIFECLQPLLLFQLCAAHTFFSHLFKYNFADCQDMLQKDLGQVLPATAPFLISSSDFLLSLTSMCRGTQCFGRNSIYFSTLSSATVLGLLIYTFDIKQLQM